MGEWVKKLIGKNKQRGVSLIAAIFIIVVLAFMGVMFVSLIGTGSLSSVNDLQSAQALSIAEGGLQYTLALNKNNMPNYSTNGAWINLGAGQFKVDTISYLTADILAGAATIPVPAGSTASFPTAGRLAINGDFGITYTNKNPANFTFAAGGQAHLQNSAVYPAAQLANPGLNGVCGTVPINVVDDTGGFNIPGIIFIDTEYFFCTGKTQFQFQNCQRCYANSAAAAHPQNRYASQYVLTSTGRVPSLSGNAERVVQINTGPYEE